MDSNLPYCIYCGNMHFFQTATSGPYCSSCAKPYPYFQNNDNNAKKKKKRNSCKHDHNTKDTHKMTITFQHKKEIYYIKYIAFLRDLINVFNSLSINLEYHKNYILKHNTCRIAVLTDLTVTGDKLHNLHNELYKPELEELRCMIGNDYLNLLSYALNGINTFRRLYHEHDLNQPFDTNILKFIIFNPIFDLIEDKQAPIMKLLFDLETKIDQLIKKEKNKEL